MVCLPCIVLPIALWIYMKILHPLVSRFIPDKWKTTIDNWLYPTCPVKAPPPAATPVGGQTTAANGSVGVEANGHVANDAPHGVDGQQNGHVGGGCPVVDRHLITAGGVDKKND